MGVCQDAFPWFSLYFIVNSQVFHYKIYTNAIVHLSEWSRFPISELSVDVSHKKLGTLDHPQGMESNKHRLYTLLLVVSSFYFGKMASFWGEYGKIAFGSVLMFKLGISSTWRKFFLSLLSLIIFCSILGRYTHSLLR